MKRFKNINLFNKKEFSNATWIIVGKIVQMILSFVISIFSAKFLGPGNYGLINYGAAYVALFTSVSNLGLNMVLVKKIVDDEENAGETIGSSIILKLLSGFLSILMISGLVTIVDFGETTTILVTILCSLSLILQSFDSITYWFQYQYKSKINSVITLCAYFLASIYKIVLLVFGKSVFWFAVCSSVEYLFTAILLLLTYKKMGGPSFTFSIKKSKELIKSSYHYILSGMMVAIYGQIDRVMLKKMLGEESVGYYSLAFTINSLWVFVLQAIIDSFSPSIMNFHKKGMIYEYNEKNIQLYSLIIYISIVVAVVLILFAEPAIVFFYGQEYQPAASTLNIIAWYSIFSYLGVARNSWLICENKQKYAKLICFLAVPINIGLNLLLIPCLEMNGAALASLITQIFTCIVIPLFIKDLRPNVKMMLDGLTLKWLRNNGRK